MKKLLSFALLALAWPAAAADEPAEGAGEEGQGRVQYTLILPEEKTAEMVKVEENNPFESSKEGEVVDEGSTEENIVREILLKMPAVGGASGPSGMRVLLGGMRLVVGGDVPPVVPDQQVALKVKSITPSSIELIWVDKKPTSLPPKVLTIPLDFSAKVDYRLPSKGPTAGGGVSGSMGSIRRNGMAVLAPPAQDGVVHAPPTVTPTIQAAIRIEDESEETPEPSVAVTTPPVPASMPLPAPAELSEAPVLRMLFGNHAPAGK